MLLAIPSKCSHTLTASIPTTTTLVKATIALFLTLTPASSQFLLHGSARLFLLKLRSCPMLTSQASSCLRHKCLSSIVHHICYVLVSITSLEDSLLPKNGRHQYLPMEDASPTHLPCPAFSFSVPHEGKDFAVLTAASLVPETVSGTECELCIYLPSEWMDGKTDRHEDGKTKWLTVAILAINNEFSAIVMKISGMQCAIWRSGQ